MSDRPDRAPAALGSQSPLITGFAVAVGVGLAYVLFRSVVDAKDILVLVALALFFAIGMDPAVRLIQQRGLRRGWAVAVVFVVLLGVFIGFGFAVIAPLVDQITGFVHNLPGYLTDLQHNRRVATLDGRFHIIAKAQQYLSSSSLLSALAGNVVSAGTAVATTVFEGFSVLILTLYFLAYLGDITEFGYRMVPRSRRDRVRGLGERIVAQLGSYVAGNLIVALGAGLASLIWLSAIGAPFPFALAFVVTMLDVIPIVGATVAAMLVSIIVLIDSTVGGIATIVFFIGYQVVENRVLVPRLLPDAVRINPVATIIGVSLGSILLGVVGFLLAIPLVAVLELLLREVIVPRQSQR